MLSDSLKIPKIILISKRNQNIPKRNQILLIGFTLELIMNLITQEMIMLNKPKEVINILYNKGFSEQWIASNSELSQGSIHKIKHGHIKNPRIDTANKLAKLYFKVMKNP